MKIYGLGRCDHIKLARPGEHQTRCREELEVRTEARGRTPDPLANHADLSEPVRQQGQDAVSLAQVHATQDDGVATVDAIAR